MAAKIGAYNREPCVFILQMLRAMLCYGTFCENFGGFSGQGSGIGKLKTPFVRNDNMKKGAVRPPSLLSDCGVLLGVVPQPNLRALTCHETHIFMGVPMSRSIKSGLMISDR